MRTKMFHFFHGQVVVEANCESGKYKKQTNKQKTTPVYPQYEICLFCSLHFYASKLRYVLVTTLKTLQKHLSKQR